MLFQENCSIRERVWRGFLFPFWAAAIVLLCYGFSPLIRFYSTDASVFYCMGKAMLNGQTAYTDFFDHKGIWLYFFYYVGNAIDSLLPGMGMYLVEIVFCFVNLYFADRIISLFITEKKIAFLCSCLFVGLSMNYFTYMAGGFSENYALSFQLISSWLIIRYYLSGDTCHPPMDMFLHGLCSGICLMLRMNLVALWVPFGITLAIRLISGRQIKNLFENLFALLLGVFLALLPPLLYGLLHHSLEDMFFAMFTFNMMYVGEGGSFSGLLHGLFFSGASLVFYLALIGVGIVCASKDLKPSFKWMFSLGFFFVLAFTFMGKRSYGHYFQILLPFTLPVFIFAGRWLSKIHGKALFPITLAICLCLTVAGNLRLAIKYLPIRTEYKNLYSIIMECDEKIGEDDERNTLLTTANMMQPYVILDVCPTVKYPYIPSAGYDEFPYAEDALNEAILSGEHKYIFGSGYNKEYWYGVSSSNYDKAKEINQFIRDNYRVLCYDPEYSFVMFERTT